MIITAWWIDYSSSVFITTIVRMNVSEILSNGIGMSHANETRSHTSHLQIIVRVDDVIIASITVAEV